MDDFRCLQARYQAEARSVTEERLRVGALIRTVLSVDDGLTLHGRDSKPKRLVIVGIDRQNNLCYGSILVNTHINPQARFLDEYMSAQYLLSHDSYPEFLDYDSYADCAVLFAIPVCKLMTGDYFGQLTEDDQRRIFDILETTDTLSTKDKKRFGIKRR